MSTLVAIAHSRRLRLSDLAMLLVAIVWGSSYGVAKGALAYYPVLGFLAVRFILTFMLLLPALWRATAKQRCDAVRTGLPLGVLLLAIFLCETFGVAHTRASNAAFLISLCVVFTPFVEWWILRIRPAPGMFLFAAISLTGASLLSGAWLGELGLGDALMLAAALLRAITVCQTSRLTRASRAPALALTAVQAGVIGFGCLGLALSNADGLPPLPVAAAFWQATAYLVLGCTLFAFFAQNWALKHGSPSRIALLTSSEPVFGALFSVVWLGETLSVAGWVGGMLIVLAALWACLR